MPEKGSKRQGETCEANLSHSIAPCRRRRCLMSSARISFWATIIGFLSRLVDIYTTWCAQRVLLCIAPGPGTKHVHRCNGCQSPRGEAGEDPKTLQPRVSEAFSWRKRRDRVSDGQDCPNCTARSRDGSDLPSECRPRVRAREQYSAFQGDFKRVKQ